MASSSSSGPSRTRRRPDPPPTRPSEPRSRPPSDPEAPEPPNGGIDPLLRSSGQERQFGSTLGNLSAGPIGGASGKAKASTQPQIPPKPPSSSSSVMPEVRTRTRLEPTSSALSPSDTAHRRACGLCRDTTVWRRCKPSRRPTGRVSRRAACTGYRGTGTRPVAARSAHSLATGCVLWCCRLAERDERCSRSDLNSARALSTKVLRHGSLGLFFGHHITLLLTPVYRHRLATSKAKRFSPPTPPGLGLLQYLSFIYTLASSSARPLY